MTEKNSKSPMSGWPKTNGMTVPDGYFDEFASRMMAKLPEMPSEPKVIERTWWHKARPYVYMAAMFAGAYLMLNIFSLTSGLRKSVATPSAASGEMIAEVVNSNTLAYVDDYISMNDYDLYDDLYNAGYEIPESL